MLLQAGFRRLGRRWRRTAPDSRMPRAYPAGFDALTEREREICTLVAARLSNREIAARLFLSEGSVKQYCNRIYSKLNIEGDTRSKRRRLAAWMANC